MTAIDRVIAALAVCGCRPRKSASTPSSRRSGSTPAGMEPRPSRASLERLRAALDVLPIDDRAALVAPRGGRPDGAGSAYGGVHAHGGRVGGSSLATTLAAKTSCVTQLLNRS